MLPYTFGQALVVFTLFLGVISFALDRITYKASFRGASLLTVSCYMSYTLLGFALISLIYITLRIQLNSVYRVSHEYSLLTTLAISTVVTSILLRRSQSNILFLVMLFAYALLISHMNVNDMFFSERSLAEYMLAKYGYWDVRWRYVNPFYNPLPMDLTLSVIMCKMLGVSFIEGSGLRLLLFNAVLSTALILNMFTLLRQYAGVTASVLTLLMVLLTPCLNPTAHGAKWLAALGLVMLTYSTTRGLLFKEKVDRLCVLAAILIFYCIFTHGSGFITVILITVLLASSILHIYPFKLDLPKTKRMLVNLATIALIILALKILYIYGVFTIVEKGVPSIERLLRALLNLYKGRPETPHRSLYREFVEPYYAVTWAVIPGLTLGVFLSELLKRWRPRNLVIKLASVLWTTGALTLLLGLAFYYSGGSYATIYPAYLLLTPLLALKLHRIPFRLACAILLLAISPLALTDPMLNPIVYRELNPMNNPANKADYIEARFLAFHTVRSPLNFEYWLLEYRIGVTVNFLVKAHSITEAPKGVGAVLSWKLYEALHFNCTIKSHILYVYRPSLLLPVIESNQYVNIVYYSDRTIALWKE